METIDTSVKSPVRAITVNGKEKLNVNGVVNIDLPESGGGSSVQADYNQNDENAPDYIKNRPFYDNGYEETFINQETTVGYDEAFEESYSTAQPVYKDVYFLSITTPDGFQSNTWVTFKNWNASTHPGCDQGTPDLGTFAIFNSVDVSVAYVDGNMELRIAPHEDSEYSGARMFISFGKGEPTSITPKFLGKQVPLLDNQGNLSLTGTLFLGPVQLRGIFNEDTFENELQVSLDGGLEWKTVLVS